MKNIIIIAVFTLFLFSSTGTFARGFSIGISGSYAIHAGAIEDTINKKAAVLEKDMLPAPIIKHDDHIEVAGAAVFLRYDFRNNLFLRTGFEANFTNNSGYLKFDNMSVLEEYFFDYTAYSIPLYLGIILSPDRGRTSFYIASGIVYSIIEIKRDINYINSPLSVNIDVKSKTESDIFSFGALMGIERMIFNKISLFMEYTLHAGTYSEKQSKYDSFNMQTYYYIEHYSLPRHQMKLGAKYGF